MVNMLTTVERRFHDVVNIVLAVLLFVSPWVLTYTGDAAAAWNAWIASVLVVIVAAIALGTHEGWAEWINIALGIWVLIAPWILGFGTVRDAATTHVVLGILIAAFAAWGAWSAQRPPTRRAAA